MNGGNGSVGSCRFGSVASLRGTAVEVREMRNINGLIAAGGAGTRLWPLSRTTMPKQLLKLNGDQRSLLQNTFARMSRSVPPDRITIVTSAAYNRQVLDQIRDLAPTYPEANVLAEPMGRDSAPAVLWGALRLHRQSPDAVVVVLWADHLIRNEQGFDEAIQRGYQMVRRGGLAAIGVHPSRPATTHGYIRYGRQLSEGVYEVECFVEKPDFQTAERLLAEGRCVWNAGIFVFHVSTLLDEFNRLAPQMMAHFRAHDAALQYQDWRDPDLIRGIYSRLDKASPLTT